MDGPIIQYPLPRLCSFDYPGAHDRHPFEPGPIDCSFAQHCAGAAQRATARMLRDWMRSEDGVPVEYALAMREFFHQLIGLELIAVHLGGGASTYEFARTLINLKVYAWKPVVYLSNFSTQGTGELLEMIDPFQLKHPYT